MAQIDPPDIKEAQRQYYEFERLREDARRRRAVLFELGFYFVACSGYFAYALSTDRLASAVRDPFFLSVVFIIFLLVFFYILTGTTPLVSAFDRIMTSYSFWPTTYLQHPIAERPADDGFKLDLSKPAGDPVEISFDLYLRRSQDAVATAKRRPNALLFVGTFIAFLGLVFFIITLPGSHFGFFDNMPADAKGDLSTTGMLLLPRLLMLAFIQVLAGFFLRQYRSAMEDFRYYEAILRHREAQYLSYRLRKQNGNANALTKFADEILKDQAVGVLAKGQTTTLLETQRYEANEFSSLLERLSSLVGRGERKVVAEQTDAEGRKRGKVN